MVEPFLANGKSVRPLASGHPHDKHHYYNCFQSQPESALRGTTCFLNRGCSGVLDQTDAASSHTRPVSLQIHG